MDTNLEQRIWNTFSFLQSGAPALREALRTHATYTHLNKGHHLTLEGNACTGFPLVISGTVRVYKMSSEAREITLYRIEQGESCILTISCLLSHQPFPAFAIASTDVEAVVIPPNVFRAWVNQYGAWRAFIFDLLARRLSSVIELVEEIAFQRVDERLAAYLAEAAGASNTVHQTHKALALDLGTSREVVSRILKNFEHEGLVALSKGTVHIRQVEELARKAPQ